MRENRILCGCALLGLLVLAYTPSLGGGFVFDDALYLTGDDRMGAGLEGLGRIWTEIGGETYRHQYYPMTSTALWAQHALWGLNPVGYHVVNVLLHGLNAVLLWLVLSSVGVRWGWWAAAVFALHPVHVVSVAWVSELKNVLSTAFVLLAALLWVRGTKSLFPAAGKRLLVPFLFLLALLSKTATCILPVGLLLLTYWRHGRITRRDIASVTPLALLGAALVCLTIALEWHHRAGGETYALAWWDRVLVAGASVWFYAWKLAWPADLSLIYPRWEVGGWGPWMWALPAGVAAATAVLWRLRGRVGRGPFVGWVYFVAAVTPISFVRVAFTKLSYVADHWAYWGSMGLIALAVGGAESLFSRREKRLSAPFLLFSRCVGYATVLCLATLTWHRAHVFESPRALWSDTVRRNPDSFTAHNNLALELAVAGDHDGAIAHYNEAMRVRPGWAVAHNNLGDVYYSRGRYEAAIEHFAEAACLDPEYAEAHYNLGNALKAAGRPTEAIGPYREALRIRPHYVKALNNLGATFYTLGCYEEAVALFSEASRHASRNAIATLNLHAAQRRLAAAQPLRGRETAR